ncbi:fimbrial protein [Achromobacter denitrificans]|uniref:fimbrial protein n=1 Tax=Achromobacter denitrificans TaxID=32002 RepID=UPI0014655C18|nr:fimbrial protein [Achromobacter denitrificans]CAB3895347.1 hypothetical protein LMG1860_05056 [Achromobacter denitrificans]
MFDLRLPVARAALGGPCGQALAGAALAVCLAVPGEAATVYRPVQDCKVQRLAEGVTAGGPWNPPQVGNIGAGVPVGTVLARRAIAISSQYRYSRDVTGPGAHQVHGGYWSGPPVTGNSIVPTNVPGIGVRVKLGDAWELKFESAAVRAYRTRSLETQLEYPQLDTMESHVIVELVVTGTVPSGAHQVTGQDPNFPASKMWIRAVQMASQPAIGADIANETGQLPSSGAVCRSDAWFSIDELITVGTQPPLVTAVCNVDARYVGYGREVVMGLVGLGSFPRPGARAGAVPFSISLSDCAAGARPKLALYAGAQGRVPGVPALKVDPGGARNVGIVLTRQGETTPLAIGAGAGDLTFYPFSGSPAVQGATADFNLEAHYQRTDHDTPGRPGVRPGPANSSVRFQVRYD